MTADPVPVAVAALVGLLLGGAGAWLAAARRLEVRLALTRDELTAADTKATMLAGQLAQAAGDCEGLRGKLTRCLQEYTAARTQLAEAQANLRQQRELFDQTQRRQADTFNSLAAQALHRNTADFLALADQRFATLRTEAAADLDARRGAIEGLIRPVNEVMAAYQRETTALEERRQRELGSVGEQLRSLAVTHASLQTETARLVQALKSPQVRGRWGEVTLRRLAELAEMSPHCDFREQESTDADAGRLRPDMVVRLPNDRTIVIDSKVPLAGFMDWIEATTDEARLAARGRHARQVAAHVHALAGKEYWTQYRGSSPEFVVLFLPNDSILATAAEHDARLVETAMGKKVVLATPSTLVALLRAVEFGWRQRLAVENAEVIRNLAQELNDRFAVLAEHLAKVGGGLGRAVEAFNDAVGSFERRILPAARRFREVGVKGRRVIEELTPVEAMPRRVTFEAEGR